MIIANPIYDIVFKYLLEDDRVARTILSALLKQDVVALKTRRNEYSNIGRDSLSVFRIDFAATIRNSDGTQKLILIEIQKTWLETETLRFRQYLGAQYANVENMLPENKGAYAIPMVTVYLLGHKVGSIEEPVLYVRRQAYDYDEHLVTKGLPDPFVDSLTHESIIVQIPRLRGQISNRLDKVLSIFDQSRQEPANKQTLDIDEDAYAGDDDMLRIVDRLKAAANDSKMRHDMNVEDEYFSVIEDRDTEIMMKNKELAEKNAQLKEKDGQLKEKDGQLKERDTQLKEKEGQLKERDTQLKEKEGQLKEKDGQLKERDTQLKEKEGQLKERDTQLKEKDGQLKERDTQLKEKEGQLKERDTQLKERDTQLKEKDGQLKERDTLLEKQRSMIRTSVCMLSKAGMSSESIAVSLNMDLDLVEQLIADN